jgi:putative CocE/NonD family hydrolase
LEARPDVLTFTGPVLEAPLEVIGPVRAVLYVRSDRQSTDFFARLCDVAPNGVSINLCDGFCRLNSDSGEPGADGILRIALNLWATAHRFQAGHRLRLLVSSGAHPRFARNPGNGLSLMETTELLPARQTVYHDALHPSAVYLPIPR